MYACCCCSDPDSIGLLHQLLYQYYEILYWFAGDLCTSGFLSNVRPCINSCYPGSDGATTRLYPNIRFTCSGTVTKWRAAARQLGGNKNTVLGIWRETSSGSRSYERIGRIELDMCGNGVDASPVAGMSGVYECTLPESSRVMVRSGDIIGTEVAASNELKFGLLYDNSQPSGSTGYIYNGLSFSSVRLSDSFTSPNEIPQISLTVEPIVEALTTTATEPYMETTITESRSLPTTSTNSYTIESTTRTVTDTTLSQTTTPANGSFVEDSNFPKELIIGALVAGLVMITLLIVIAFVLAYLSRRLGVRDGDERPSSRKGSNLKKNLSMRDMEYNAVYGPQILMKDNVAYDQSPNLYTVVYDTILDIEPGGLNTMTCEVSVSNIYTSVP